MKEIINELYRMNEENITSSKVKTPKGTFHLKYNEKDDDYTIDFHHLHTYISLGMSEKVMTDIIDLLITNYALFLILTV